MKKGKVELISEGELLGGVTLQRDALSPLLFVIAMMPFNYIKLGSAPSATNLRNHKKSSYLQKMKKNWRL